MKLTSKVKKGSIGPILLIAAFILWFIGMSFPVWYFTGLLGLIPTVIFGAQPIFGWFERDGFR